MVNLLNSTPQTSTLKQKIAVKTGQIATKLLGAVSPQQQAQLPRTYNFDAHVFSKYFSSTHYGIMIPDFPAPYQYLSCAAVIGDIGASITHVPESQTALTPHNTATLVHGTALSSTEEAYQIYNIEEDLKFQQQPFKVEFADQTQIYEESGLFHLKTRRPDLTLDLILSPTLALTWFTHSPIYQHFSVLMQYEGFFQQHHEKVEVKGLCTLEHWKSISKSSFLPKALLNDHALIPLNAFSYQVINLDHQQQLVLAFICFAGQPAYTSISYRHIDGISIQYEQASFEVTQLQTQPHITPDGYAMFLPQCFRWIASHQGQKVLDICAEVDTPYCYGLAAGYVGAYHWTGQFQQETITGRGYLEYIDRR